MIKVQFYGVLQEIAGAKEVEHPLAESASLTDVLQQLQEQIPTLAAYLPRVACAVDDQIVPRSQLIQPGSTLALLPPVSGGIRTDGKDVSHV